MYGISNSQQQGGGGGGAASYKAIKSTLTPSDWQEVPKQPYFVGSNAMEWPIDDAFELHAKRSNDIIGLTSGVDYTISVTVDGQVYTKTAQIRDTSQTSGMKILTFGLTDDNTLGVMIYDDVSAMMPGVSSFVGIEAPTTVTSFVITSFTGVDFGSSGKATISDSAITVNSAVTMYTNTSAKISVGETTNGNVTLIAPSVPETAIPYSLEIVGTDTEGLFELVNGYIPDVPKIPASLPQTTSDFTKVSISPSQWTKVTFTDGSDYYSYEFDVENMTAATDALFRVNYAGYIEIEQTSYRGETGTATMEVTVKKLPTETLYIYYRIGQISGVGDYGTNVTVVNQSPEFITDKPDHLYLTDTATGTLYEVTVANGTISLVAQSST